MYTRKLGRSGLEISALGLGCWAIGGPFWHLEEKPASIVGYGQVDDQESVRAIRRAIDLGVNFFDTSDAYGCGHSEHILGQAIQGRRQQVIIATKFGYVPDEDRRLIVREEASPAYIRQACEASLRRLGSDWIDLYQFHIHDYDLEKALEVRETLEALVAEGKIRWYGWSLGNEDTERIEIFAQGPHCTAIQHTQNIFITDQPALELCEQYNLASINQGPLSRGLLTGKFDAQTSFPEDDMRHHWGWNFQEGRLAERLEQLARLRAILTRDGRSLAQAALGWIWAHHPQTIPIPGFKHQAQAEENAGALTYGPLSREQMQEIDQLLGR